MKKGFTLVEILVSLVIVSVLAAMMFAGFSKARAKGEKYQAIVALKSIRASQKMYYAKNRQYASAADTSQIKSALDVETQVRGSSFSVTAGATTFSAAVTGSGWTLTLDQDGNWGGTGTTLPTD